MIRWITSRIGTAAWNDSELGTEIRRVDVRDLVDRSGNNNALVLAKIHGALGLLESGHKVVVCCDLGMSRSNAIAAGILSLAEGLSLADAARQVVAATKERRIKVEVLAAVARALGAASPLDGTASRQIVVIGGSGFVGSRLAARLSSQSNVSAPTHAQVDVSVGAVELFLSTAAHRASTMVHLARPRVVDNTGLGEALTMLRNTLDVCRETGARLVFLSSAEVFSGHATLDRPAAEQLERRPGSVSGEMYALCEDLIEHHQARSGLPVLLVRSALLYDDLGSRPALIRKFADLAQRGDAIVTHRYRNGRPLLDLLHVEDAADALAELILRGEQGVFHLGASATIGTADLARKIVGLSASKSPVSETRIEADCANIILDGSKLAKMIGWQPRFQFEPSLAKALSSIHEHKEPVR